MSEIQLKSKFRPIINFVQGNPVLLLRDQWTSEICVKSNIISSACTQFGPSKIVEQYKYNLTY
jgi:hypothetical protein